MIKILHYLRNLGLGGTEKTCELFFKYSSSDFDVVVAYEKTGDHTRLQQFRDAADECDGRLYEVDSHSTDSDLVALINKIKPDIVHVYRSGFEEYPEPGTHIDVPHFVETNVFGFVDRNPLIDRTLFMSRWLMDNTLRGFYHSRFDYVNNPVEEPYTQERLPGLAEEITWLGRCGRPDNGIYNAVNVEAARLLRLQGHDVGFIVMAPPSNMIDDLKRHGIPYRAIKPTTDPVELSKFYNSVDIYAHARADGETFGVNIAEAMMHGKPVVTHIATPSNPQMGVFQSQTELVDHGSTGIVVNNNAAEYSEALKVLLDPVMREGMGAAGFIKAVREYHVDACVRKLEKIYREITNGKTEV